VDPAIGIMSLGFGRSSIGRRRRLRHRQDTAHAAIPDAANQLAPILTLQAARRIKPKQKQHPNNNKHLVDSRGWHKA
jgi:hypothetical protein